MKNVVIYGASETGKRIYDSIKESENLLYFVDGDKNKWSKNSECGYSIIPPLSIVNSDFDKIYIGVQTCYKSIYISLLEMGIPKEKIDVSYVELPTLARIEFLKNTAMLFKDYGVIDGCVAEVGVYKGEFAKELNKVFHDKKLYLFDTFQGFSSEDVKTEMDKGFVVADQTGKFNDTSKEIVLEGMEHPENIIICGGHFPETSWMVESEKFCFVNLDVDLYSPTLAGLDFFFDRLVQGGIILVHDYFSKAYNGAREAVKEFSASKGIQPMPIGDTLSVAFRKQILLM